MAERHVDPLFSTAYDGELDDAGRRRFDAHLAGCARCAEAFDDYRTAIDAVRALPAVSMPATVRLPAGPPQVEAGRAAVLGRLRDALLHPPPVWAAAGLAAVGVAAVVLAVHHGGGTSSTALNSPVSQGAASAPDVLHGNYAPAPITPVACPVAPVAGGGAAPPDFVNSARKAAGTGRELVLATPADSYAPGASVPIYARLTNTPAASGGASDVIPCVTLETLGAATGAAPAPQAAPGAGEGRAAAGAPAPAPPGYAQPGMNATSIEPTPLAVATSGPGLFSAAGSADSAKRLATGPLLTVVIPSNIPRGTVLRLVAVIPPHFTGNPTDQPIHVELLITVR
jgi:hypothetical protein